MTSPPRLGRDGLVSIITPAWRAAAFIEATIASVIAQSYEDWELIVADDCSPDATRAVVAGWAAREPRIRLLEMPVNGGPAAARNGAIAVAAGRWLAYLDSDDQWLPGKLERQLAFHAGHDTALTYTGFRRISGDGAQLGHYIGVPARLDYNRLLGNTAIATSTVLLDRWRTGAVTMKRVYYDDLACWLDVLRDGGIAYGLDEDLMRYRVVGGSISRNKKKSALEVWRTYRDVEGLGLIRSTVSFAGYAVRGYLKYRRF